MESKICPIYDNYMQEDAEIWCDKVWHYRVKNGDEITAICKCPQLVTQMAMKQAFNPASIQTQTFENFKGESVVAKLKAAIANPNIRHIIIQGVSGTGKSHLCYATLFWMATEGTIGTKVSANKLIEVFLQKVNKDKVSEADEWLNEAGKAPFLIIEDLGNTVMSNYVAAQFENFLDEYGGKIIVTVSIPIKGDGDGISLLNRIGSRNLRRLMHESVIITLSKEKKQ